jgi:hypothetical protein
VALVTFAASGLLIGSFSIVSIGVTRISRLP